MRKSCISTLTGLCLAAGCSLTANAQVITENFDNVAGLTGAGWVMSNQSAPLGTSGWFQGNPQAFPAQAGATNSYIGANFQNTTGVGTISNWLLTPAVQLQNNMQLKFWTRQPTASTYPDRLQVRMSLAGASTNTGTGATGIGDFTTLLLDINPTYQAGVNGYPQEWTQFTINLSGIGAPTQGRLAFRYFVENGGPNGANSDFIGIDTLTLSGPINPCTQPLPLCRADVAPVGGNNVVNVDDLLAVINTWGQTQNPPGTGPRPQGDTAPLPNGNCLVNVDDLLTVINAWGNCPVPTGACCAPAGTCSVLTQAACTAAGGNYQGNGVACATVTCPVLPANDNCAGAITVTNGQTNIDNTSATDSTGIPGGACIFNGPANVRKDLWFAYTATCTGRLSIDLCSTGGAVTDTTLQLFTGACVSLTEVACDDDGCGTATDDDLLSSISSFDVTAGQQFRIRVGTWANSPSGPMVMTIGCVVPTNDQVCDATPVAIGGSVSGVLSSATQDSAPVCNGVAAGVGRWHTVVGNGTTLTASTCTGPGQIWDGAISVYCGSSCNALICVNAANSDSCNFFQETVSWCAASGQTYWILVHSPSTPSNGNYTLTVTSGAACTPTVVCGAANDECAGAITLVPGANNGDNSLATTSAGIPGGACAFQGAQNFTRDVWFKYTTGPAQSQITLATCATAGSVSDTVISVFTGTCGSLTEIGCDDDSCGDANDLRSSLTLTVNANTQILVRVGSWNTAPAGPFTLTLTDAPVTCPFTLPANACTGAFAGNGNADGVNGTRPNAGWQNGALGVMEDFVVCDAGGSILSNVSVAFIDQIAAGVGTPSPYTQIRMRIYALTGAITALNPSTAVPLFQQDFTVGVNATKTDIGDAFNEDIERWTLTVPPQNLAAGSYGIYFSFPTLNNPVAPSVFIATGPGPNPSTPQQVHIWGLNGATPVNAAGGQHSAFCVGGTP